MRILTLFLFLISFSGFAIANPDDHILNTEDSLHFSESLNGIIRRTASGLFLETQTHCRRHSIEVSNSETFETLHKLTSGDAVMATGRYDDEYCKVTISNIDYIGLKQFIGHWSSKEGVFIVHDFKNITFIPSTESTGDFKSQQKLHKSSKQGSGQQVFSKAIQYQYSVTSSVGSEWVMFLSNEESTTFTTLFFKDKSVTIKIYDSENGSVKKTIALRYHGL
jgi:hypothetical protein